MTYFHSFEIEIGLGLLAFGGIFIFFGIMLLFDTGLMIIGNVLFEYFK